MARQQSDRRLMSSAARGLRLSGWGGMAAASFVGLAAPVASAETASRAAGASTAAFEISQSRVSQSAVGERRSVHPPAEVFTPTIVPPFSFSIEADSVSTQRSGYYIQSGIPIYVQIGGSPIGRRTIRGSIIEDSTLINPTIINSDIQDSTLINPTIVLSSPTRVIQTQSQTQYLTPGVITPPRRVPLDPATLPENCTAFSDGAIACW